MKIPPLYISHFCKYMFSFDSSFDLGVIAGLLEGQEVAILVVPPDES
jgi:hypothetical protein